MPAKGTTSIQIGGTTVVVIRMESRHGPDYFKGVPQCRSPSLGLGAGSDGSRAHSYLYEDGREVDKGKFVYAIPQDCLSQYRIIPGKPLIIDLPENYNTFSALGTASNSYIDVSVDIEHKKITIEADKPQNVFFAAFEGSSKLDWRPIRKNCYNGSSDYH
jgi:hypothetical protein